VLQFLEVVLMEGVISLMCNGTEVHVIEIMEWL
jgi:hypothetical protein